MARLATIDRHGHPHLVPICFAVDGDTVYTAVDAKPKSTTSLRRLDNVAAHPEVSVLADHYDDADWSALWWVRADGTATVLAPGASRHDGARALLMAKYPQYRTALPPAPVVAIDVHRWSAWSAGPVL